MSGYNRSCSRAVSSILLAAQCAAALSIMPASALSCWAQGVTAASYKEYAIWVSPSGGILGRDHRGSAILLPTGRRVLTEYSIRDICPLLSSCCSSSKLRTQRESRRVACRGFQTGDGFEDGEASEYGPLCVILLRNRNTRVLRRPGIARPCRRKL